MMDLGLSKRWTERWEGRRSLAYDDATGETIRPGLPVKGNPTIGVGMNLKTAAARILIAGLGLEFDAVIGGQLALTGAQVDHLLTSSLSTAVADARRLFSGFDQFPEAAQLVIVDLCFNMGGPKLATFHHACAAIRSQNWPEAAAQLQASEWFHQVGSSQFQRGWSDAAVLGGSATPDFVLNSR
jgi:GH24 family phage-related lysozyme (muramidase)